MHYARSLEADSVDGTKWAMYTDTYLADDLAYLDLTGQQLRIEHG